MYLGSESKKEVRFQLFDLPSGADGVRATLALMSAMVKHHKKTPEIRNTAADLIQNLPQKAWSDEVRKIHAFVRDNIRYTRDVRNVETVQSPDVTLKLERGDCDDKSTLLAALLESIGHATRFVAIGMQPDFFSHVYVETLIGNKWIALETTENKPAGWIPKGVSRMVRHN